MHHGPRERDYDNARSNHTRLARYHMAQFVLVALTVPQNNTAIAWRQLRGKTTDKLFEGFIEIWSDLLSGVQLPLVLN